MNDFADVVAKLIDIISGLIPLVFALTLLVFVWKVVDTWIIGGADESKREQGRKTVVIGVIVFVVMFGIWGILRILRSSLF